MNFLIGFIFLVACILALFVLVGLFACVMAGNPWDYE